MNPGPVEEGGKAVTAVVDAMKSQPLVLAVLLVNVIMIAAVYLGTAELRASTSGTLKTLLDQQKDMIEKLYNCTPLPPTP